VSGQVSVLLDVAGGVSRRLTTCTPGMLFGEMALLEGRPPSATVRADEAVECFAMPAANFERLGSTHPDLKLKLLESLARRLSLRVRKLTDEVRTLSD